MSKSKTKARPSQRRRTAYQTMRAFATGGVGSLEPSAFQKVTVSVPTPLMGMVEKAAENRGDNNKSAVFCDALAEFFGIEVSVGGDPVQAA